MSHPRPTEIQALNQAENLLLFAGENTKDLPASVVKAIADSWSAKETNQWDAGTSTIFWTAFNSLSFLIKPVTVDTLTCNQEILSYPSWTIWHARGAKTSVSKRTARRYLGFLLTLLFVSIALQFVVSTAATLSTQIEAILGEADQIVAQMNKEIAAVADDVGKKNFDDPSLSVNTKKDIKSIEGNYRGMNLDVDKILAKQNLFRRLTSFGVEGYNYRPSTYTRRDVNSLDDLEEYGLQHYYHDKSEAATTLETGSLTLKILNFTVLPILLGTLGASAYVTRLISDQIKDTTFSSTSSVRHLVRVGLGALAGVVVGFGWIGSSLSWSPLALAFVAGYAIEPVFATIDGIAEKFRKP